MKITINEASVNDAKELLDLIHEMALSQGDKVSLTQSELEESLKNKTANALLARVEGKIVGYAAWNVGFHTYDGNFIYIDDIYVNESCRRKGVGKKLLLEIIKIANQTNSHNIEWLVANDNVNVLDWSDKMGSVKLGRYQYRRLSRSQFRLQNEE